MEFFRTLSPWWVIGTLGLVAVVLIYLTWKNRHELVASIAAIMGLLLVAGTLTVQELAHVPFDVEIDTPAANDDVPVCIAVRGTGSAIEGKTLLVAYQAEGDPRKFFEQDITFTSDSAWRSGLELGNSADPATAKDRTFRIYALQVEDDWAEYLGSTNALEDQKWWSSPDWPPDSERGEPIVVRGLGTKGTCE